MQRASIWASCADQAVGVPGAAALGVLLAVLAWQRACWTPGLELEARPGWAALIPLRAPVLSQTPPVHLAIFAVVADPTEALMALPGDMRCGDAEMGRDVAESGRYGVAGPPDNPDPHLARPVPGRDYRTGDGVAINEVGLAQPRDGTSGLTAPWGRDTALGTDARDTQGSMWGDVLNEDVGERGLGLAGLAGGIVKRFDVAPSAVDGTASLRVVHTGLRVTGARKASEVGRAMAAHFGEFRACAESAKNADGARNGRVARVARLRRERRRSRRHDGCRRRRATAVPGKSPCRRGAHARRRWYCARGLSAAFCGRRRRAHDRARHADASCEGVRLRRVAERSAELAPQNCEMNFQVSAGTHCLDPPGL